MHPILFKIGPTAVYSYGFMMALAFGIATYLLVKRAQTEGIAANLVLDLAIFTVISGIIGARLMYVILNTSYFLKNPVEIFMISHGGLVWYGGFIFSTLAGLVYLRMKKMNILRTMDIIIPYVAIGQAIGRIGCLLNGCCFGKESRSFFFIYTAGSYRWPAQIFESLGLLAIFLLLGPLYKKKKFDGEIFLYYVIFYSVLRFFIEYIRADSAVMVYGLRISQFISITLFIISAILISYGRKSHCCR